MKFRVSDTKGNEELLDLDELLDLATTVSESDSNITSKSKAISKLIYEGYKVSEIKEDGGIIENDLPFPKKTKDMCGCGLKK